jgi:hypothetical protein
MVPMIGEALIAKGYITRTQLDRALAIQKHEPDRLLGQVLIDIGCCTVFELLSVVSGQLADKLRMEAGITPPVGKVLLDAGLISPAQLEASLFYQERKGGRLGDVLVELRLATRTQIEQILEALGT